jgi:capsular exopolysaccharide synthesis family protein
MSDLVTLRAPNGLEAEAYRSLRTNLLAAKGDARVLLVASPEPGAGAAECACNLAVACAQAGLRVAVVDGDLRDPAVHVWFGMANEAGLAEAIAGREPPAEGAGPVDGLRVVTAGRVTGMASDVLARSAAADALSVVRKEVDLMLVVAPPVLSASDAATLARNTDGVLLVVASGKTRRRDAAAARDVFDHAGVPVLGVVLTGVDPDEAALPYFSSDGAKPQDARL